MDQRNLSSYNNSREDRLAIFTSLREKSRLFLSHQPACKYLPSEPPKMVWWSWLQGEANAPEICKVCLDSVRKHFSDWKINIISLENYESFVNIPDFVKEKFSKGSITHAHFSDILRTCLLVEHGGLWLDATILCTGLGRIGKALRLPLFFYTHAFNNDPTIIGSSWLLSAQKHHPIMQTARDLLFWFWQQNSVLPDYYLFHLLFHVAAIHRQDLFNNVPMVSNVPPHLMQLELFNPYNPKRFEELKHLSDFHKLTWKIPESASLTSDSLYNYLLSKKFLKAFSI